MNAGDFLEKRVLHLITQDDQPYGSVRRCCERCGTAVWNCDYYIDESHLFTKTNAADAGYVRCVDDKTTDETFNDNF